MFGYYFALVLVIVTWLLIAAGLFVSPFRMVIAWRKQQRGRAACHGIAFSFCALLLVVALTARPDYTDRARIVEGLSLAAGAKTAISVFYEKNHRFPSDNSEAGMAAPSSYIGNDINSVEIIDGGQIVVLFGGEGGRPPDMSGRNIILKPEIKAGTVLWDCREGTMPKKYRPSSCR